MRALLVEDDKRVANFVEKGLREASYAVRVGRQRRHGAAFIAGWRV